MKVKVSKCSSRQKGGLVYWSSALITWSGAKFWLAAGWSRDAWSQLPLAIEVDPARLPCAEELSVNLVSDWLTLAGATSTEFAIKVPNSSFCVHQHQAISLSSSPSHQSAIRNTVRTQLQQTNTEHKARTGGHFTTGASIMTSPQTRQRYFTTKLKYENNPAIWLLWSRTEV